MTILTQKEPKRAIDDFYREHLNLYINYHRYCGFATDYVNEKGKIRKKYDTYMTPVQKLLLISDCEKYLKKGVTKESLIDETKRMTHFEVAQKVFEARSKLFKEINKKI
mgnify:CR=1